MLVILVYLLFFLIWSSMYSLDQNLYLSIEQHIVVLVT